MPPWREGLRLPLTFTVLTGWMRETARPPDTLADARVGWGDLAELMGSEWGPIPVTPCLHRLNRQYGADESSRSDYRPPGPQGVESTLQLGRLRRDNCQGTFADTGLGRRPIPE